MSENTVWMLLQEFLRAGKCVRFRVKPGAKREMLMVEGDVFVLALRDPAVEGRANRALLRMVKKRTGVRVRIVQGIRSREKRVCPEE